MWPRVPRFPEWSSGMKVLVAVQIAVAVLAL